MARVLDNPRLTVAERASLLAEAAAGVPSADLAAKYDTTARSIQRILKKAGLAREHGGSRGGIWATGEVGAGQTGKGSETAEERFVETPEMVWISALARAYGLGLNKQQWGALVKRYPFLRGTRRSPAERLRLLGELHETFFPVLEGRQTGNRDMGDDFQRMVQAAFVAISAEEPAPAPFVDEDVLRGFEEQVAVGELVSGARRARPDIERGHEEIVAGGTTFWGASGPPIPDEPKGGPVTSKAFGRLVEERTRLLEEGEADLETMEAEAGVRHIDPAAYLEAQALRDEVEAIRRKEKLAREVAGATGAKRRPKRPPSESEKRRAAIIGNPPSPREDAAATALAALWLHRAASGFKMPKRRTARKKRAQKRESKSALFRRLMRI